MGNPHKPGTPEWQQWLNDQIAKHDAQQKARDAKIDADLRAEAQKLAADLKAEAQKLAAEQDKNSQ